MGYSIRIPNGIISMVDVDFKCPKCECTHSEEDYYDRLYKSKHGLIYKQYKDEYVSTFNLWEGNKYKSNILKYRKDYNGYHPTQKPVLLLEDLIKTFSNENDLVVDLTAGSFSTAIACINTKRKFIGIEKDKNYFNIGKERIKKYLDSNR